MDALLLSRIQFGFTIGFHILFPTLTIGLAWFLVFFEAAWHSTRKPHFLKLYFFWVKIFALTFGMGVVSGLVLSYEIGTNFSRFAEQAGPVLGPLLSVEVLTAFFVEAGFLGIMLFGWDKVGPRLHFMATLLVAVGTTNSAFWILSANSFMQTPQGAEWIDGRLVPVDWLAVVFNPSFPYRLAHMLLATGITSALVVAAVSAGWVRRLTHRSAGLPALKIALLVLAVATPLQILVGDLHGLNVQKHQPTKIAAMEGLWQSREGAPLLLFAWPDQENRRNLVEIGIPKLASIILQHDPNGRVIGMDQIAAEDLPPVLPVFWSFRVMVGLGLVFLLIGVSGMLLWWRGRLEQSPRFLAALNYAFPLGFIATVAGWLVAEIGRQPFVVYGLIRTRDAVSPIAAAQVMTSLAMFVLVYLVLFSAYLTFCWRLARQGPAPLPEVHPKAIRGARPGEVVQGGLPWN